MDINPYQAPRAADQPDLPVLPISRRSWPRHVIGICSSFIALLFVAIGIAAPEEIRGTKLFWFVIGYFAASFVAMGVGMLMRRDKVALLGFMLFVAPFAARIAYLLIR